MIEKTSYGLLLYKHSNDSTLILLGRKRLTYEFIEFALGRYYLDNNFKIKKLLNKMTADEKIYILTNNYDMIWWKLTLSNTHTPRYHKGREMFYSLDKVKLGELIINSKNGELLWDIPKGRPNNDELPYDTAIREVYEEIGINGYQYNLKFKTFNYSTREYNVIYNMKFFLAELKNNCSVRFKDISFYEIDNIRWFDINDIQRLPNTKFYKFIYNSFIELLKCCKTEPD